MFIKWIMPISFGIGVLLLIFATKYSVPIQEEWQPKTFSFRQAQSVWIDSLMTNMSLEEKVGQLILFDLNYNQLEENKDTLEEFPFEYNLGGVIFNEFPFGVQKTISNKLIASAEIPLLMGMRGWDSSKSSIEFPNTYTLKAIRTTNYLEDLGFALGSMSQDLGVHLYFPPEEIPNEKTVDAYLEVIRHLHEKRVVPCSFMYPPQKEGKHSKKIGNQHLSVYKQLLKESISALYVAPAFLDDLADNTVEILTDSMYYQYFHDILKYRGLLITQLSGSKDEFAPKLSRWIQLGGDMIVLDQGVHDAINILVGLVKAKVLDEKDIDERVRKVLQIKYWTQHSQERKNDQGKLAVGKEDPDHIVLNRTLDLASLTLVEDEKKQIPLTNLEKAPFCMVVLGNDVPTFKQYLSYYSEVFHHHIQPDRHNRLPSWDSTYYAKFEKVIFVMNEVPWDSLKYRKFWNSLRKFERQKDVVVVNFGQLSNLAFLKGFSTIFQTYNHSDRIQSLSAQALFGGVPINGKLPVSVGSHFAEGKGLTTNKMRMAYSPPEEVGIDRNLLGQIDSIVHFGIREQAMPGCQIIVAKSGHIIYNKAFGYHTYDKRRKVQSSDLYDIASVTKVAGTTLASMRLADEGKLNVDHQLGYYFNDTDLHLRSRSEVEIEYQQDTIRYEDYFAAQYAHSASEDQEESDLNVKTERYQDSLVIIFHPKMRRLSKEDNIFEIPIRDLLTHHSGVPIDMPLYPFIHNRQRPLRRFKDFYREKANNDYTVTVADNLYLKSTYRDSILKRLKYSKLYVDKFYQYSDLNMILVQWVIDSLTHQPLDEFLQESFYAPLGLYNLQFNPWKKVPSNKLIPTLEDREWRRQVLRGYVHDPAAALMGGVAGNAGLFSNANDLAILCQMLLNGGVYGGERYLEERTILEFTSRQEGHRGFGFDKPPQVGRYVIGNSASKLSFGHTGFTGTCIWVDPEHELIFVFLSNRIYPDEKNMKLNELRIRSRIHQVVYQAIKKNQWILQAKADKHKKILG